MYDLKAIVYGAAVEMPSEHPLSFKVAIPLDAHT